MVQGIGVTSETRVIRVIRVIRVTRVTRVTKTRVTRVTGLTGLTGAGPVAQSLKLLPTQASDLGRDARESRK